MAAADRGAVDRLHPLSRLPSRRIHTRAKNRDSRGELWRKNGLARPRRRFPDRPYGKRDARCGELQLRYPGVFAVQRPHARDFRRLPGNEGRLFVGQRKAGLGNRGERKGRGQVSVHSGKIQSERRVGRNPPSGRNGNQTMKINRRTFVGGLSALALPAQGQSMLAYIGTYTHGKSKGIYVGRYANGELSAIELAAETPSPSFLALHPNRRFLYAVNELDNYQGKPGGSVTAFSIEASGQ